MPRSSAHLLLWGESEILDQDDIVDVANSVFPRYGEQTYWWEQHARLSIDAYHRVVWHADAHIRQNWCLRGAIGAVDRGHFPAQFWH